MVEAEIKQEINFFLELNAYQTTNKQTETKPLENTKSHSEEEI